MPTQDTATRLLDAAQELIQTRGYNAFSYKDLSEQIGIRTASIHYHFPAKSDLGAKLMERYCEALEQDLAKIEAKHAQVTPRLRAFVGLYKASEKECAICLCGSMASDWETLTPEVQALVSRYLDSSEAWIAKQIRAGCASGELHFEGNPREASATFVASLQGALLLARAHQKTNVLAKVQATLLASLQ